MEHNTVFNPMVLAGAALIPMILGFIWYHPKVMGTMWMDACGFKAEDLKGGNMGLIFGLSYVFSFMLAIAINFVVIHQNHLFSALMSEPGFQKKTGDAWILVQEFMTKYGSNFRTFKHGAFHGLIDGILFALPILATNAMFERKGFKYIFVNSAYWIICISLMGGVICQFS